MTIVGKNVNKINKLLQELAQEIEYYESEDASDEQAEKFNEVAEKLGTVFDSLEDFNDAFNDFADYLDSDHEEFYFNNSYNGVSDRDFYDPKFI